MRFAAFAAAGIALAAVASSAGAPPTLKQKQAQARQVLAQVNELDIQLGRAAEAWNGANYELGKLRVQERQNATALAYARGQFRIAERRAEQRIVELYQSNEPSTTDAILGAATLSDMLNRIELVDATSALDRQIARRVAQTRDTLARKGAELAAERRKQASTVAFLAGRRAAIEVGLARRKELLANVQGEVRKLQAQERARQARLAAQVRARLAAEQRRLALERQHAAALAKQREQALNAAASKPKQTDPKRPASPPLPTATPTTTEATPTTTTTTDTTPVSPALLPAPVALPAGHPEAASIALQYLGVPYQWGGASPLGFDCSGLVLYVYAKLGISLPHFAAAQYGFGTPVPRDQLQPGDLVFFDNLNHVGISLGGDQFIHAPHTGDFVKIETLSGWYATNFVGARRL